MVGEAERKSEIITILKKDKDIFDDLINSSNIESSARRNSLDRPRQIDKGLCNAPRSKGNLLIVLEENYLDENVLFKLLELVSTI